jgi:hypothetical protein
MRLRICDGERERILPASVEAVEQTFAPEATIREGTEITLADGERWVAALAVGAQAGGGPECEEFLLSGDTAEHGPLSGRVLRDEVLQRFREFVLSSVRA